MRWLKNGLQRKSCKKRGGASSGSQNLRKKVLKRRQKQRMIEQIMSKRCLLVQGQHINTLLLTMKSMLKATQDLIQNNDVIRIESIRALKEQNESLTNELNELKICNSSENQTTQ